MDIKRADQRHLNGILEIAFLFYAQIETNDICKIDYLIIKNHLKKFISHEDFSIFVLTDSHDNVSGVAMGMVCPVWYSSDIIGQELMWYVDKRYRGRKGLLLKKKLEIDLCTKGANVLNMISIEKSMDVSSIYKRHGYIKIETAYMKRV